MSVSSARLTASGLLTVGRSLPLLSISGYPGVTAVMSASSPRVTATYAGGPSARLTLWVPTGSVPTGSTAGGSSRITEHGSPPTSFAPEVRSKTSGSHGNGMTPGNQVTFRVFSTGKHPSLFTMDLGKPGG